MLPKHTPVTLASVMSTWVTMPTENIGVTTPFLRYFLECVTLKLMYLEF